MRDEYVTGAIAICMFIFFLIFMLMINPAARALMNGIRPIALCRSCHWKYDNKVENITENRRDVDEGS